MVKIQEAWQAYSCGKRWSFSCRKAAKQFARKIGRSAGVKYQVYVCPKCGRFHMTTKKGKGGRY